jgi:hypothetical protein
MSTINEPPIPTLATGCDFYFEQGGPTGAVTYDGDTYPYAPLPSDRGDDYRYELGTTPVFLAVVFDAIGQTHPSNPKVITPPGVSILEYFWDFGDGATGYGPVVTHTYEVADPTTSISLRVLDSLGRSYSASKSLSLVIVDFGYIIGPRIRGINTETPPKKKFAEAEDESLTVEGTPQLVWVARAGKPVREETEQLVTTDRVTVRVHYNVSASEVCDTTDVTSRTRLLVRGTTDEALSADSVSQTTHRLTSTTEESLTEDGSSTAILIRRLQAILKLVGSLVPNKL